MDDRITALASARYISLTTYRRDGRAVATPVWCALDGQRILVWTDAASGKAKRIRAAHLWRRPTCVGGRTGHRSRPWPGYSRNPKTRAHASSFPGSTGWSSRSSTWYATGTFIRRKPRAVEVYLEITSA